jgi:GPI inositol-deacylase
MNFSSLDEVPPVVDELAEFCRRPLPRLLVLSFLIALIPLPRIFYTGNAGEPALAIIAPILLLLSSSLVCVSYFLLRGIIWPLQKMSRLFARRYVSVSVICIKY